MKRAGQKTAAWLCLTAVLFLQLAVAAYACPAPTEGRAPAQAAVAMANQPCHGLDQAPPKLCEQHCIYAAQSVDTQPHSAVQPPVSSAVSVVVWQNRQPPARSRAQYEIAASVAGPPPLVRFGVLRI
jgi:hypothetical protein